jgi:hypothetical protein
MKVRRATKIIQASRALEVSSGSIWTAEATMRCCSSACWYLRQRRVNPGKTGQRHA